MNFLPGYLCLLTFHLKQTVSEKGRIKALVFSNGQVNHIFSHVCDFAALKFSWRAGKAEYSLPIQTLSLISPFVTLSQAHLSVTSNSVQLIFPWHKPVLTVRK